MAANVETMFYVRETPWHGLGTRVMEAPGSEDALELAGLNWKVRQEPIYTDNNLLIPGYKANVRDLDDKVLGVVTDRYKVVQNDEAFAFTDIKLLLPYENEDNSLHVRNINRLREDMQKRYFDAPDLKDVGNNAYRFVNAVSDFATHSEPIRRTKNFKENLFSRTVEGNPLIDKAYQMLCAA